MRRSVVLATGLLLLAGAAAAATSPQPYVNATTGGPLRAGVYGRIEIRNAPPPPVIHPQPVTVAEPLGQPRQRPIYLYVPPGHARKWDRHCDKYQACATPVYFVRVDDSPSRLGKWKEQARASRAQPGILHAFSGARD
ncbi:MAG TPA: hypothetical protein VEA35_18255 [Ramlibacter sp.]|nr:hypothetical protein [Ramlibacter sp.]